ncbi:amino acid permease-domain-containing protein [Zychaea mexicana]|uniref:amino acid permease-domain-containing protein n=1 Tax=Zychaea mexicana TaxID=64656 RepID=UPI0022FE26DD|nr:amino acid permease-domain-containing protein [Zychaea mexicana]KAI9489402.1 amino acid permease-domain-containing protein [Zychaea mexicana]
MYSSTISDPEKHVSSTEEIIGGGFTAVCESRKGVQVVIDNDPFDLDFDDDSITTRSVMSKASSQQLKRSLKARHLAMISLGGVIGQGLFLSSGANLNQAGPGGALIAYGLIGILVFWVAYSLGEMSTYIPVSGSFTIFCRRFVDHSFGTMIGYNYWACWSVVVASELVAVPIIMSFWTNALPDWAWSGISLVIVLLVNLLGARSYGETEYWFSLIKILAVIIFIIVGCLVSGGLIGDEVYGFKYWSDPGAFPNGAQGIVDSLILASFSMQGTEIVGITAGEAGNPKKEVPRAIKNVFWRIIIFYIGAIFVMGMVIPYTDTSTLSDFTTVSPFTIVFSKGNLDSVAHIMNAVILITVLSCANSGLYVASRTLLALAQEDIAWRKLCYISERGVPVYALVCTSLVSLITFATFFIPGRALFTVLTKLPGVAVLVTWTGICIAHFRFRRAFKLQGRDLKDLPMTVPMHPIGDILDVFVCPIIALFTGYKYFIPAQAVGIIGQYLGLILCLVGFIALKVFTKSKLIPLKEMDLDTGRSDISYDPQEASKLSGPWYARAWKRVVIALT